MEEHPTKDFRNRVKQEHDGSQIVASEMRAEMLRVKASVNKALENAGKKPKYDLTDGRVIIENGYKDTNPPGFSR